jgi:hypothetical protein
MRSRVLRARVEDAIVIVTAEDSVEVDSVPM